MTQLNRRHFTELFRADYKTVAVTFNSTRSHCDSFAKRYTYKVPKAMQVAVGEKLVVFVNGRIETEQLQTVTVAEVHENPEINSDASFKYKWAVAKFDDVMAQYQDNVRKDNQLKIAVEKLETALSRISLKKQLQTAMSELDQDTIDELQKAFGFDIKQVAAE